MAGTSPTSAGTPTGQPSALPPTSSPLPSANASPAPTNWLVYTDDTYSFQIAYPPNFTFKREGSADPGAGWLADYRAVDTAFVNAYPPGQVEIAIYVFDAGTLADWTTKHTGVSASGNGSFYWHSTTNARTVISASRPAIAFDATIPGFPVIVHSTAFIQASSHVVVLSWWATDPAYVATASITADRMLATFNG